LNGFKKKVENVTAELIAITEPHEIKQQSEVTRYEDIKEQERQEKLRLEQERIDGIKNKIKSYSDLFNSKIQSLTFFGIDDFKTEFEEFVSTQSKEVFDEFEILYSDMLDSVKAFLQTKVLMLTEQEQNRLEQIRLSEERAENERKLAIRNSIQSYFNNWSAIIDTLSFFNKKEVFDEFLNEKIANCQEFQEEYASNRGILVGKFENKIKFLNQVEDNRIISEKLAKEKAEFEEKQLEVKYQERKKFLVDQDFWRIYLDTECSKKESIAKSNLLLYTDESFKNFEKIILKSKELTTHDVVGETIVQEFIFEENNSLEDSREEVTEKSTMTLKEKFKQWLDTEPREQIREVQLEIIADEFAIEFAVWICNLENNYLHILGLYEFNKKYREKTFSELLEIYKKEKGL